MDQPDTPITDPPLKQLDGNSLGARIFLALGVTFSTVMITFEVVYPLHVKISPVAIFLLPVIVSAGTTYVSFNNGYTKKQATRGAVVSTFFGSLLPILGMVYLLFWFGAHGAS